MAARRQDVSSQGNTRLPASSGDSSTFLDRSFVTKLQTQFPLRPHTTHRLFLTVSIHLLVDPAAVPVAAIKRRGTRGSTAAALPDSIILPYFSLSFPGGNMAIQ